MLAAVAAERQGGIALLDISDPANINLFFDFYINGQPNDLISPRTKHFFILSYVGLCTKGLQPSCAQAEHRFVCKLV
jgi:hypothetical protein